MTNTKDGWNKGTKAHRCNIFPTVWAAIYGCKGERVTSWRYTIGNFGKRVPEYACETCKAAKAQTDAVKGINDRSEYQRLLREAQDAAGVEDYRLCDARLVNGVPTIVGTFHEEEPTQAPETVLITGNTFPVKEALKALGGHWDASERGWRVPAAKAADAKALVC